MNTFIGIDPGTPPTLARLTGDTLTIVEGEAIAFAKTRRTRGGNDASYLDTSPELLMQQLWALIKGNKAETLVAIERVTIRPGEALDNGQKFIGSMFMVVGGLAMIQAQYRAPTPMQWKKDMKLPGKTQPNAIAEVRRQAVLAFPKYAHWFSRQKDHNRAEAALLALWAKQYGEAFPKGFGKQ